MNGGHPSVYGDWLQAPGKPTLLLYGHYDVQPVDPLGQWRSPPFKATIVGENLYARGASDDKGQFFIHLKAVESYLRTTGQLPINIKVWLEGEEEINSPILSVFLNREASRLQANAVLVSDTEMLGVNKPSIIYFFGFAVGFAIPIAVDLFFGLPKEVGYAWAAKPDFMRTILISLFFGYLISTGLERQHEQAILSNSATGAD